MKIGFLSSTLIAALLSSTAFAEYKTIPQSQLETYKKAVVIAGQRSSLNNCHESGAQGLAERDLGTYIKNADSGKIDLDGNQPILIFECGSVSGRANTKAIATIITSRDYKSVTSIKVEELQLSDVNTGDLLNPHIVKDYVVTSLGECN